MLISFLLFKSIQKITILIYRYLYPWIYILFFRFKQRYHLPNLHNIKIIFEDKIIGRLYKNWQIRVIKNTHCQTTSLYLVWSPRCCKRRVVEVLCVIRQVLKSCVWSGKCWSPHVVRGVKSRSVARVLWTCSSGWSEVVD